MSYGGSGSPNKKAKKSRNVKVMLPTGNLRLNKRTAQNIYPQSYNTPDKLDKVLEKALGNITTVSNNQTIREYIDTDEKVKDRELALKIAKRRLFDINFINNGRITGRLHHSKILEKDHLGNKPYLHYLQTGVSSYCGESDALHRGIANKFLSTSPAPMTPDFLMVDPEVIFYDLVTSHCVPSKSVPLKRIAKDTVVAEIDTQNLHQPVIDLDIPSKLIPSFQDGHSHLYLDMEMTWPDYLKLLKVMAEVGIIEKEYYEVSKKKGYTAVRSPCNSVVYPHESEYTVSSTFTVGIETTEKPRLDKSEAEYLQDQIDFLEAENEKLRERLNDLQKCSR